MPSLRRNNREYRDLSQALKRKARRNDDPCWICGQPINFNADWRDPMSFTYDHVVAIANGGKARGDGRPAHRSCNSRRGAAQVTITPPRDSRDW